MFNMYIYVIALIVFLMLDTSLILSFPLSLEFLEFTE